ncbi:MAG TPA: VOC family protein [Terriglobales bacterium]|nr:VOC family protein [Terriglobales bacterium]
MHFRFDAVFYYVSDFERAIRFYSDVLGFKLNSRDAVARFDLNGILFEIVPARDKSKFSGQGNARLCLEVDDVQQALDELRSQGVPTSAAQNKDKGVLASFQDPDGNELCIWQYS